VSPPLAPAPGGMLVRLEDLAAELAARGRQARVVTRAGGLPFLRIAGEPGSPDERIHALPRRERTWAYWRPGPVALAAAAASAADIIARSPAPWVQFPVAGPGRDKTGPEAAA